MTFFFKKDAKAMEKKIRKRGYKTVIKKEVKTFDGFGVGWTLYAQKKRR